MTFKTEIIEYGESKDKMFGTSREPLRYRLMLKLHNNELILIKEYFKLGFNDNEEWDKWWINTDSSSINWVSIITKKFYDTKYMKELETKIFEIFYDESIKMTKEIKKNILKYTKRMNIDLSNQQKVTKFVDKFNRRRKLKNINKITENESNASIF